MEDSSTSNDIVDFPDERKYLQTIAKATDSQPTKNKVTAFKSRVFKLIKIYTEKADSLSPLLDTFTQEIFLKEPEKMNEIVQLVLNKQSLDNQRMKALLDIYKILLLYKNKNQQGNQICQTFVKLLKKFLSQEEGEKTIQQMVQIVFTKRSCKLNIAFFQFLIRKIPSTKQIIHKACVNLSKSKKLRPAQIKQLQKLKSKVGATNKAVKKQQIQE